MSVDRIGIERLCVFDLPPVEFVNLTADLGCRYIGIGLTSMGYYNPHGYPSWSLRDNAGLRREMLASMRDRGVSISLCEGFGVKPNGDVREYAADLDLVAELGCRRINVASVDRDVHRSFDQFAMLTAMGEPLGIETTTEVGVGPVRNLSAAIAAHRHVGRRSFRLLIDTMHFVRHGGSAAEIAALDPDVIGYVQLCDVPLVSTFTKYMEEALHERMVPGTGELPLLDILAALPSHLVLGLEVPQRSLAQAGEGPHERVGRCIKATRDLLTAA
jgi:sugar phosphate isomerase/epimerase